eukprot:3346577-Pleurochrysis_carterae.AAC.1
MPGSDRNFLAHQQPYVVKELPGFDPNHQISAQPRCPGGSWTAGCRSAPEGALCSALLAVKFGGHARDLQQASRRVITFMASTTPSRSEAGLGPAGPTPPRATSASTSAALGD